MNRRRAQSPLFDYLTTQAWALEPGVLDSLVGVVQRHLDGVRLDAAEIATIVAQRDARQTVQPGVQLIGSTAVIPITGVIARHSSQVNGASQPEGTSTAAITEDLRAAVADPAVQSILLAIDSPGGSVDGVSALADEIHAANAQKKVVAHIDGMGASAAYWLASQASRVVATKDSTVGSIGVYAAVRDTSRAAKNAGVDVHVIKAGRHKAAGVPGTPIESADKASMQERVNTVYGWFTDAVARGRGMTEEQIATVADGQVWLGQQAMAKGLVDELGSFEHTLAGLNGTGTGTVAAGVHADDSAPVSMTPKEGAFDMTKTTEGAAAPVSAGVSAPSPSTLERIRAESPHLVEQIRQEGFAAGVAAERARMSKLAHAASDMQRETLLSLIDKGASVEDGLLAIIEDGRRMKANRLDEIRAAATAAVGTAPAVDAPKAPKTQEEKWREEFAASETLRAEFGDVELFVAFQRGSQAGAFTAQPRKGA